MTVGGLVETTAMPDSELLTYGIARGNYLQPNGLGGYVISASAIGSWSRCQLQRFYELRARHDPDAPKGSQLSATAYGSVMHSAIMQMEKAHHEGRADALDMALRYFEHYWHPANIAAICPPIDEWLPQQTWNGLLDRGRFILRQHFDNVVKSREQYLIALEHQFAVPFEVAGRTHTLTGAIDRLMIARYQRRPYIAIDDLKTGRRKYYLRYNTQGGFYAYATTQPEFWSGGFEKSGLPDMQAFPDEAMASMEERFATYGFRIHAGGDPGLKLSARKFRWIDLQNNKTIDGGWRVAQDYARLALAIDAYVRASEAEIYSVNAEGEICRYCPFRHVCGGVGLPADGVGAP